MALNRATRMTMHESAWTHSTSHVAGIRQIYFGTNCLAGRQVVVEVASDVGAD